ncbi:hypothetical protein KAW80_04260 [Candidatus Babeliales bacterium]|nr:hypothetical protein [Candidatus Babeliales bacterium]
MVNKEFGFVLKRFFPKKHKFSVLTKTRGKLEIVPSPINFSKRLWPGMLISFVLTPTNTKIYFANSLDILFAPLEEAGDNLIWIHSLLELCYYFSPPENPSEDAFQLLHRAFTFVYFAKYFDDSFSVLKKMFTMKLLKSFGFFPDETTFFYFSQFERMVLGSVDFPNKREVKSLKMSLDKVDEEEKKVMDSWIKKCLMRHPGSHLFKTLLFKNG